MSKNLILARHSLVLGSQNLASEVTMIRVKPGGNRLVQLLLDYINIYYSK